MNRAQYLLKLIEDSDALVGLQKIVNDKTMGDVNGVSVDLTTANMVLQVYNALSPANQAKMKSMPVKQMIDTAMKLIAKVKK